MKADHTSSVSSSFADVFKAFGDRAADRVGLVELASALVQLRSRAALKQSDVATRAGLPTTLISELENARNDGVTWRTIVRLARGMGARLDVRFVRDAEKAGDVTIEVEGDYVAVLDTDAIAGLIDEQNDARSLYLAA